MDVEDLDREVEDEDTEEDALQKELLQKPLSKRIGAKKQDRLLGDLLRECKRMTRSARSHIGESHSKWDDAIDAYNGTSDSAKNPEEDRKARKKNQPESFEIPLTQAQVQTFVTFNVMLYFQNEQLFQTEPTGNEDYEAREEMDKLLKREELVSEVFNRVVSMLLDVGRFGIGVLKTTWEVHKQSVTLEEGEDGTESAMPEVEQTESGMLTMGEVEAVGSDVEVDLVDYEGTVVQNVSPYNFLYDTRLPLARWKEGRFAGDETMFHIDDLHDWEDDDAAFGVKYIDRMDHEAYKQRGKTRLEGFEAFGVTGGGEKGDDEDDFMVCVSELEMWIKPSKYALSPSNGRQLWVIRYANDQRIISAEPLKTGHMGFCYDVAYTSPDEHAKLHDSLAKLVSPMQQVVTWLFNSRIASVRTNIHGRIAAMTQHIEMEDLVTQKPYIRIKKSAPMLGIDKILQQMRTVDTTMGHFSDADSVMRMGQSITGINENTMGQFNGGRRSATEARNVSAASTGRLRVINQTMWKCCLSPMGNKFKKNIRREMSPELMARILGDEVAMQLYDKIHVGNLQKLVLSEDYFIEDATTAIEKGYVAQSLQELLVAVISNPQIMAVMPLDLPAMLKEIQLLRGVKNVDRFILKTPEQLAQLQNGLQQINPPGPPQSGGLPNGGA